MGAGWGQYVSDYMVDSNWCMGLRDFLGRISDEYFILMLDDYYVMNVDRELLDKACEYIKRDNVCKVDLSGSVAGFANKVYDQFFYQAKQDAQYRSSLQMAIWKRDYLKSLCPKDGSAWHFEIIGQQLACNDNAIILGGQKPIVTYLNLLRRGCWYGKNDYERSSSCH